MKKALSRTLAIVASAVISVSAFAEATPAGNITLDSIEAGLQARNTALHPVGNALAAAAASAIGSDTYIMVINYSNTDIVVDFPNRSALVTQRTSARYERTNYTGGSHVDIYTSVNGHKGALIKGLFANFHDIISVYVSDGKYVVYDTP
jgi:hypothetical protein